MAEPKSTSAWPSIICMGTGALGVASGFAVFFLFLEDETPLTFVEILLTATVLSVIIERLREIIDDSYDTPAELRPHPRPRSAVLVSLLIVGLSELFALAWHALIGSWNTDDFKVVEEIVAGGAFTASHASHRELVLLVGVWMVSGMALAFALATRIAKSSRRPAERMAGSAAMGAVVGGLFAPAILFAVLITGHALKGLGVLILHPDDWRANFHTLQHGAGLIGGLPGLVLGGIFWVADHILYLFGESNPRAPLLVVAIMIGFGVTGIRQKAGWLPWVVLFTAIGLVMAPLLPGIGGLVLLLVRTGVIWALPGVVLGALVPLLERQAEEHRWWAVVAFAAAVVLVALTAARLDGRWWLLVPTAGIVAAGWFVWRTGSIAGWWPILAISVATLVTALTFTVHQLATFSGVLGSLYDLRHLPDRIADVVPADTARTTRMYTLADYMQSSGTGANQGSQVEPRWLAPSQRIDFEDFIAKDVARLKIAEDSLDKLGMDVTRILAGRQNWSGQLDDLRRLMAPPQEPHGDAAPHGEESTFRKHLAVVVDVQRKLTNLDGRLTAEVHAATDLADKVRAIHRREDEETLKVLSTLDPSKLGGWQAAQVRVWKGSQALLDQLMPYQRELESVLGAPASGQPATGLTAFKTDFTRAANDVYTTICRWLELGLAGSFGFWTTLGLLAGWSLYRRDVTAES